MERKECVCVCVQGKTKGCVYLKRERSREYREFMYQITWFGYLTSILFVRLMLRLPCSRPLYCIVLFLFSPYGSFL